MKKLLAFSLFSFFIFHLSFSDDGISGGNPIINISVTLGDSVHASIMTADTVRADSVVTDALSVGSGSGIAKITDGIVAPTDTLGLPRITGLQDSLTAHTDTNEVHRAELNQHQDSVSKHTDSLETHRTALNQLQDSLSKHTDSLETHRTALNQLQDSLSKHTDSLETHRTDINALKDSVTAHRDKMNLHQSDSAAFVTSATRLAVSVPAALPSDIVTATPRGLDAGDGSEALPVADDFIKAVAKADSIIFLRVAGTTSGLKFNWNRDKK